MNADQLGFDDPDLALLDRFRKNGDREALGALFQRHAGIAYRVARRFFHDTHEAEDAVQTAFLNVMRQADQFQRRSTVKTWLLAAVVNACRMKQRGERRREQRDARFAPSSPAEVASPDAQQLHAAVMENLEKLPEEFRLPLWMHYCEGLPFTEIADSLLISEPSARRHAKRGLELLRECLPCYGAALATGGVAALLTAAPAEAAPATLSAAITKLAATPLHLLPAAPLAGHTLAAGAALKTAACVAVLAAGGAFFALYNQSPTAAALNRGGVQPQPAAPIPEEVPEPKPPPAPPLPSVALLGASPELQKILDRQISLRLTGDYLSGALYEIRRILPRDVDLSVSTTEACLQGPWPGVKFEAESIRIDDALKLIAEQLKLRLAVRGGEIFFWRELPAEERTALNARLRDPAQTLDARTEAARDLLRCGDIQATADVLRALLEEPAGLTQNGPGFAPTLLPLLRRTLGYRLTEDPAQGTPLVMLSSDAPLRTAVRDWLVAQNWVMSANAAPPQSKLDAETLSIRRAALRDFNLRLAAIFDLPEYLLSLSPNELRNTAAFSWALAFVREKRCDEVLWNLTQNPTADIKEPTLALGARRDPRVFSSLVKLARRGDGADEIIAERAVRRLARYDHATTNAGAVLEELMRKDARRPSSTAAVELGRWGDPERVRGLLSLLDADKTPQDLYYRATIALAQLKDPALDPLFLKLLRDQHLPDSDVLTDFFTDKRSPACVDALGEIILDPKLAGAHPAACYTLGNMHSRAAVAKLIELCQKGVSQGTLGALCQGLKLAHDPESEEFLATLATRDNKPGLRFMALECLQNARTETGIATLRRDAFDPMLNVRVIALNALKYIDSDAARETLMKAMATEPDPTVRAAPPSCAKHYDIWDLKVRRNLFAALRDAYTKDPPIRFALLRNLSVDLGASATRTLMEQALADTDKSVPYIAVEELTRREETYVEALALLLNNARYDARLRARAASIFLYPSGSEEQPLNEERLRAAFKTLQRCAENDPDPLVRLAAVFSLNRDRNNPATAAALKALAARDASQLVRDGVGLVLSGELQRKDAIRMIGRRETVPGQPPERDLEF